MSRCGIVRGTIPVRSTVVCCNLARVLELKTVACGKRFNASPCSSHATTYFISPGVCQGTCYSSSKSKCFTPMRKATCTPLASKPAAVASGSIASLGTNARGAEWLSVMPADSEQSGADVSDDQPTAAMPLERRDEQLYGAQA